MKNRIFGYLEGEGAGRGGLKLSARQSKHEEWTQTILPADNEAAEPEGSISRRPLVFFGAAMIAGLALLIFRIFILQVLTGDTNLKLANGNRIRERVERAPRGMILDRNKEVLARNQASYDVVVVPQLLSRDEKTRAAEYDLAARLLGADRAAIVEKIEGCTEKVRAICLSSPLSIVAVSGVERDRALLFDQSAGSLPGFSLDVNPIREYTDGGLLGAFLGYTGRIDAEELAVNSNYGMTDFIGKLGLEKQYESVLRGTDGGEQTEVDATGRPLRVLSTHESAPGDNLVLSIDMALQRKLAESVSRQMEIAKATRASAVAVNPNTGEILAAVSLPSFDNNLFSRGISTAQYQGLLNDPAQPLLNKVVNNAYPSGSIIKPLTASAALQEGIINTKTTVLDRGELVVTNKYDPSVKYTFRSWEHSGLGIMNVFTAIARSSNIFFFTVAGGFTGGGGFTNFSRYLGVEKLTEYYNKFGLGKVTGVDLPTETAGRVPTPEWKKAFSGESWYTGDTYNISVGQGDLLVSPLQMAMAVGAVANGGTLYRPHLGLRVESADGKVKRTIAPEVAASGFVSAANLEVVRQGMRQVIAASYGTACCKIEAEVPVHVAGKTGSAETDPTNNVPPHSWFVAFAPYEAPQIVTVVLIEKSGEGSEFAAPATRETLAWYFREGAGAKWVKSN